MGLNGAIPRTRRSRSPAIRLGRPTGRTNGDRDSEHYDRKLEEILRKAVAVFCARGYHQASIRDISRATGVSLAGLYYYFQSKEQLLYLVQRHAFERILASARAALEPFKRPQDRLRAFVRLHLQFFLDHPDEMKVLTHEEEWLAEAHARDLRVVKKAYYKLCFDEVEALRRTGGLDGLNTRVAVLSLFGMINWIYTWYNPKVDPQSAEIAGQMTEIFLDGIRGSWARRAEQRASRTARMV
jgi:AcrR family transcriptional regulator